MSTNTCQRKCNSSMNSSLRDDHFSEMNSSKKDDPEAEVEGKSNEKVNASAPGDLYQVLQVPRDADLATIKSKYLQLALVHHPDKPGGDLVTFKNICLAYKVLSNKTKRAKYDSTLSSTIEELRSQENRDTEYHVSDTFVKFDDQGERQFDDSAFNAKFSESRTGEDKEEMSSLEKEVAKKVAEPKRTLEEILAERDRELNEYTQTPAFNDQRPFDQSIFNQMFNDMKARGQELNPYNEVSEGPGFVGEDNEPACFRGFGSYGGDVGIGLSMRGTVSSNEYNMMFEKPLPKAVTDEIRSKVYTSNADGYIKDQIDPDTYEDDLNKRFEELKADFYRNKYLDKDKYIVKKEMTDDPLGDPELFQTQVLGIEALKEDNE